MVALVDIKLPLGSHILDRPKRQEIILCKFRQGKSKVFDEQITQKAGNNSSQTQIFVLGIDEKRVHEIFDEKIPEAIREYSREAIDLAKERMESFRNDLVPKLVKENLINSLKDPSVQVLLLDAQRSATSTERLEDYSLLSELLIHRIKKGDDRNIRAGVSGAIKIVDEVSCEALLGLTVLYSVTHFVPVSLEIKEGLEALNRYFSKIVYDALPLGEEWMDHLDVLNAIRTSQISKLKHFEEYYAEKLLGYIDVGIDKSSSDYKKALEMVEKAKLPRDILCEHELRQGYVRLKISDVDNLSSIQIQAIIPVEFEGLSLPVTSLKRLSEEQEQTIKEIYSLYASDIKLKEENRIEFFKLWDSFDVLRKIKAWWDNISLGFSITSVGKALAHANARRCDPALPEFF